MTTHWNEQWKTEANRDYWQKPDKTVIKLMKKFDKSRMRDVLDLGCGVGRHTLCFAKEGFKVTALDSSSNALGLLQQQLDALKLDVNIVQGDYSQDLFKEESFDFILAFNVIYHGYQETFQEAIRLVHKWLRPDGLFFFTCPTRKDDKFGNGKQVSVNTYSSMNGVVPGDIHYFADEADITEFLKGFKEVNKNISEHYWDNRRIRQFSSNWEILAKK